MIRTTRHVPQATLARYAIAPDQDASCFDAVREHLARGCERCVVFLESFKAIAFRLPDRRDEWIVPQRVVLGRGVRGAALADYQIVCGAGPYELDLLVREHESMPELEIVGQVTRSGQIYDPIPDLSLGLIEPSDPAPLVTTSTDVFGEFNLGWMRDGAYGLRLGEESDAPCVLVWQEDQSQ